MLIAIGHQKDSGKDTFVNYCLEILNGKNAVRVAFADKLYDFCHSVYGWAGFRDREYYVNNYKEKDIFIPSLGCTPRQKLIEVSNWMRKYDPDIWLNAVDKSNRFTFAADVRYSNEFNYIKNNKGLAVKIIRDSIKNRDDVADSDLKNETRWDFIFDNNGTKEELRNKAQIFCNYLLSRF